MKLVSLSLRPLSFSLILVTLCLFFALPLWGSETSSDESFEGPDFQPIRISATPVIDINTLPSYEVGLTWLCDAEREIRTTSVCLKDIQDLIADLKKSKLPPEHETSIMNYEEKLVEVREILSWFKDLTISSRHTITNIQAAQDLPFKDTALVLNKIEEAKQVLTQETLPSLNDHKPQACTPQIWRGLYLSLQTMAGAFKNAFETVLNEP